MDLAGIATGNPTPDDSRARRRVAPRAVLLALLLTGLLFTSVYPLRRYFDVRAQVASLRLQDHALAGTLSQLSGQKALLQTDAEVERLARAHLGMVRPGEVPFVIATPQPVPDRVTVPDPTVDPPAAPKPSLLTRWWDTFARALRVRA